MHQTLLMYLPQLYVPSDLSWCAALYLLPPKT